MNAPDLFPTLWKVIDRLERASISYMLTGSVAMNLYGHPRATHDFDIVIRISASDVKKIFQSFERDFYVSEEAIREAVAQQRMFNVIDNETVFKVDFIIAKLDPVSLQQFARRREIELGQRRIWVISPEDLILAKLEWSHQTPSELQDNDVRNIIRVSGSTLDQTYLSNEAQRLGLKTKLDEIYASIGYRA